MTRKDYQLIAGVFNEALQTTQDDPKAVKAIRLTAMFLSSDLERDNPRFDRARFLTACGVN